jgi:hypothetical protein
VVEALSPDPVDVDGGVGAPGAAPPLGDLDSTTGTEETGGTNGTCVADPDGAFGTAAVGAPALSAEAEPAEAVPAGADTTEATTPEPDAPEPGAPAPDAPAPEPDAPEGAGAALPPVVGATCPARSRRTTPLAGPDAGGHDRAAAGVFGPPTGPVR